MSRYVTVSRKDKRFKDYMLGHVPDDSSLQSIPVQGFNDTKYKEKVTFKLVEKEPIKLKSWPKVLSEVLRLKWLSLTLTPVAVTLVYMSTIGFQLDVSLASLTLLCIFFSHASVFILNDFYDHIFGIDSISSNSGTRVIQNAWLTAKQMQLLGYTFLGFSVISGSYLAYLVNFKLLIFGFVGLIMSWSYTYLSKIKRILGLNGFIINMFMGPFLVLGVSWGLFAYYNLTLIAFGLLFGLMAYICISYRHLENLFLSQKSIGISIVDYLGFDKAKIFILLLVAALPVMYAICITFLMNDIVSPRSLKVVLLIIPLLFYVFLLIKNFNLKTSMGSSVTFLREYMAYLHAIFGLSLILFLLV